MSTKQVIVQPFLFKRLRFGGNFNHFDLIRQGFTSKIQIMALNAAFDRNSSYISECFRQEYQFSDCIAR